VHPQHLDDVRSALVYLQHNYGFGANYVLVGHSAGGALAFQLVASSPSPSSSHPSSHSLSAPALGKDHPALPAAIISFEGLYDFTGINERYGGAYATFFKGAFGEEEKSWDEAAPIKFPGIYAEKFPNDSGSLILLGSSPEDTLVDELEAENMAQRLRDVDGFVEEGTGEEGEGKGGNKLVRVKDLSGDHDEIWRDGKGVARMVWIALRKLGVSS
jgi:kynurenine formamidase